MRWSGTYQDFEEENYPIHFLLILEERIKLTYRSLIFFIMPLSHSHTQTHAHTHTHTHPLSQKHTHAHALIHTHTHAHLHTSSFSYPGKLYQSEKGKVHLGPLRTLRLFLNDSDVNRNVLYPTRCLLMRRMRKYIQSLGNNFTKLYNFGVIFSFWRLVLIQWYSYSK